MKGPICMKICYGCKCNRKCLQTGNAIIFDCKNNTKGTIGNRKRNYCSFCILINRGEIIVLLENNDIIKDNR